VNIAAVQDFVLTFTSILWEAMPFIVLGALVAGILEELLPQQLITRIMPKSAVPAVIVGGLLGLLFPMCECGIVVVMRRLLRKGVPLACCVAYMLAGPIVNVIVLLSTYVAFGPHGIGVEMIVFRAGLGFLVACGAGLVVFVLERKHGKENLLTETALPPRPKKAISLDLVEDAPAEPKKNFWDRLSNISATATHDFIDITVFLILGALLAATAKMYISSDTIAAISNEQPYLAIPLMMGLAVLMCLCSEADAFVAASFTKMHFSAKLAFLVLGPMLDLKLLLMYTRVFRLRLIVAIVTAVVLQVFAYTTAVHTFMPATQPAVKSAAP
jgi:uncharacterized protein